MAKRSAAGSGTITHRKDGRWEAKYSYTDKLGQPKRGSVYGQTQKECRQKLTQILKEVDEGGYQKAEKSYTVKEWFTEWLDTYMLGHYSSSFTMDVYAAVSETMKQDTRERMEQYIQRVSGS